MDSPLDYISVLPSVAAVVSAFIALLVAQFFKDNTVAKVLLVIAAGILGVVAIGATIYGQHQIVAAKEAAAHRNEEIRNTLGNFTAEGLAIVGPGCADPSNTTPPVAEVDAWRGRIIAYLASRVGQSYVPRLATTIPILTASFARWSRPTRI
jgi:hypothetical protein